MMIDLKNIDINEYPSQTYEKIRYADMDRQGHVNNALFSTFLETGRIEILHDEKLKDHINQSEFVIAHLSLNFLGEIEWPGTIEIGTGIINNGNSSMRLVQGIFQKNVLKATAESVIVQVDVISKKAKPLSENYKEVIKKYMFYIK